MRISGHITSGPPVALIPARKGSKGIRRKNLATVAGKPLVEWAIRTSLDSELIEGTFVTTDDPEIQSLAIEVGAAAPFLRPDNLAGDSSTDYGFVEHFLHYYQSDYGFLPSLIVHLRPTVPIRDATVVDDAIRHLQARSDADSLRSVNLANVSPYKMWELNDEGFGSPLLSVNGISEAFNSPRQELPVVYEQNCYVDIYRSDAVLSSGSLAPSKILMFPTERSIDVDTEIDLIVANCLATHFIRGKEGDEAPY